MSTKRTGIAALETVDVLGVECVAGTTEIAASDALARVRSGQGGYGVFCNVHLLMTAGSNPEVARALADAWHVFPDGAPVAWLQRRQGIDAARRIGGPDFMLETLDIGREAGIRHMLFGTTESVIWQLQERLRARFPGVDIVDAYAPARGLENSPGCIERLRAARPDIIWCALGAPKQELWMHCASPQLGSCLLMGVGAAFDFHSATKRRAPRWMQDHGIEWLHRLLSEPRRLSRRYLVNNSKFVWHAIPYLHARGHAPRRR